ncbi:hypothetical protein FEM48_Zijuj08G0128000 [Ziziphus jujuba var. spinosa]|uniref:Uncharacterized protein n=1 Tax=Ziziphus jujuba var. spinosa TaxID=714518 RepID=A0A978UZ72_ZIZJJ|nr:hypothetical protein FEM48_Zijuj08G0128000 [Ziziphus jujuba var. spinosa]
MCLLIPKTIAYSCLLLYFLTYFYIIYKSALWELDSDYYLHVSGIGDDIFLEMCSACIKLEEYQIAKFKRCQGHGRSCLKKHMALKLVLVQADTLKCRLINLEEMHHMNHMMFEHIAVVSLHTSDIVTAEASWLLNCTMNMF